MHEQQQPSVNRTLIGQISSLLGMSGTPSTASTTTTKLPAPPNSTAEASSSSPSSKPNASIPLNPPTPTLEEDDFIERSLPKTQPEEDSSVEPEAPPKEPITNILVLREELEFFVVPSITSTIIKTTGSPIKKSNSDTQFELPEETSKTQILAQVEDEQSIGTHSTPSGVAATTTAAAATRSARTVSNASSGNVSVGTLASSSSVSGNSNDDVDVNIVVEDDLALLTVNGGKDGREDQLKRDVEGSRGLSLDGKETTEENLNKGMNNKEGLSVLGKLFPPFRLNGHKKDKNNKLKIFGSNKTSKKGVVSKAEMEASTELVKGGYVEEGVANGNGEYDGTKQLGMDDLKRHLTKESNETIVIHLEGERDDVGEVVEIALHEVRNGGVDEEEDDGHVKATNSNSNISSNTAVDTVLPPQKPQRHQHVESDEIESPTKKPQGSASSKAVSTPSTNKTSASDIIASTPRIVATQNDDDNDDGIFEDDEEELNERDRMAIVDPYENPLNVLKMYCADILVGKKEVLGNLGVLGRWAPLELKNLNLGEVNRNGVDLDGDGDGGDVEGEASVEKEGIDEVRDEGVMGESSPVVFDQMTLEHGHLLKALMAYADVTAEEEFIPHAHLAMISPEGEVVVGSGRYGDDVEINIESSGPVWGFRKVEERKARLVSMAIFEGKPTPDKMQEVDIDELGKHKGDIPCSPTTAGYPPISRTSDGDGSGFSIEKLTTHLNFRRPVRKVWWELRVLKGVDLKEVEARYEARRLENVVRNHEAGGFESILVKSDTRKNQSGQAGGDVAGDGAVASGGGVEEGNAGLKVTFALPPRSEDGQSESAKRKKENQENQKDGEGVGGGGVGPSNLTPPTPVFLTEKDLPPLPMTSASIAVGEDAVENVATKSKKRTSWTSSLSSGANGGSDATERASCFAVSNLSNKNVKSATKSASKSSLATTATTTSSSSTSSSSSSSSMSAWKRIRKSISSKKSASSASTSEGKSEKEDDVPSPESPSSVSVADSGVGMKVDFSVKHADGEAVNSDIGQEQGGLEASKKDEKRELVDLKVWVRRIWLIEFVTVQ
jgi:hypothetical protein